MSSLYKPLNEHQVMEARFNLLKDGEYDAFVTNAIWSKSSSGNVMADINVRVFDKEGVSHDIRDFLVFTDKMLWKIKHFCDSANLQKTYEDGLFTPELANNQNVRVLVGIKVGDLIPTDKLGNRPVGTCYPNKNTIIDYVMPPMQTMPPVSNDFINDDIPF